MNLETHTHKTFLSDYQSTGISNQKRYAKIEYIFLNDYQNFLYNRALFGLSVYKEEELKDMHWEKKKRINKVHKRTQRTLNLWKQTLTNVKVNNFMKCFFPNSRFFDYNFMETCDTYINKTSFKELGINKIQIIDKLLSEGLLPINFYQLKTEETCK